MKIEIKQEDSKNGYTEDQIEDALECLMEAEKVKQDLKLMALVQAEIRKQQRVIKSIQDIKDRYVEVTTRVPESDLIDGEAKSTARTIAEDEEGDDE